MTGQDTTGHGISGQDPTGQDGAEQNAAGQKAAGQDATAPGTAKAAAGGQERPLVGVVLVSHSATVAAAVAELSAGLTGGARQVPLAPAGGAPDGGLGTSSELIASAARSVDRGAGVAVIADLGSAVLTVKALLADEELPAGTRLVDAPFLEGAVAAVVTSSAGGDLDAVAAAAGEAYTYRKS